MWKFYIHRNLFPFDNYEKKWFSQEYSLKIIHILVALEVTITNFFKSSEKCLYHTSKEMG